MLIGLLSDSHIPETCASFPASLRKAFTGVEAIFHAGDIYNSAALDQLEEIAPVLAARGDDDLLRDPRVKEKHILEIGGLRVGLIHVFEGLYLYWGLEKAIASEFGSPVDVVVFGHTHSSLVKQQDGVLLVNPGSALLPNYLPRPGTVGLLEIKDGQAQARLVGLE